MRALGWILTAITVLALCSLGSNAKVFDLKHIPKNINQLRNGDSFSVECKDNYGNADVIDLETVDVDAATVTIAIPGRTSAIHTITNFAITNGRQGQDRFGQQILELHLILVEWGRVTGGTGVGLIWSDDRWLSHHDDGSWWTCAN